ncbi:DNA-processing protein DprA [Cytobacillus sp. FSL R5-0569]|uniref:DNA-processing protein DprA n=1 Tax=Cytobacillus sp. FSL R5-0569 TaxID=2921649 RepID=UPI0030F4E6B8
MNDLMTTKLLTLHHCRSVSWKTLYQIVKADPTLSSISFQRPNPLPYFHFLNADMRNKINDEILTLNMEELLSQYVNNDIKIISIMDENYPKLLRETYQPPWFLYAKGDLSLLNMKPILSVVGSRNMTEYGARVIEEIFPTLIKRGFIIASGLAKGVDAHAHKVAMHLSGHTIGVLGSGFFNMYPTGNRHLFQQMSRNHLVLSEYPPHTKAERWHFPMRNRIISGISRATLVIEAKRKSGSLITANFAVQEGRDVFAVPGGILSPFFSGTNELIQNGAKLILSAEDIIEELVY